MVIIIVCRQWQLGNNISSRHHRLLYSTALHLYTRITMYQQNTAQQSTVNVHTYHNVPTKHSSAVHCQCTHCHNVPTKHSIAVHCQCTHYHNVPTKHSMAVHCQWTHVSQCTNKTQHCSPLSMNTCITMYQQNTALQSTVNVHTYHNVPTKHSMAVHCQCTHYHNVPTKHSMAVHCQCTHVSQCTNKLAPYGTDGRLLLTANFKVKWHKN